jgi:hypothetical protein
MNNTELAISFREQIRAFHEKSVELDEQIRSLVLEKVNTSRACGLTIEEARASLGRETFHDLVNELNLDSPTLTAYVRFSRKHQTPFDDFRVALGAAFEAAARLSGLLEIPHGHGEQTSHDPPPFFAWSARMVMQFKVGFQKYLAARPLKTWEADEREQFAYSLRPILKVHKMLTESFHK